VTIACNGFNITGPGNAYDVYGINNSKYNYTTIKNCRISGFDSGINSSV
jgi:hypothetical protein